MPRTCLKNWTFVIAASLMSVAATYAKAQNTNLCGSTPDVDDFVGTFSFDIGSAILTDGSTIVPLDANNTFSATFFALDGELVLSADPTEIPFVIAGDDEPDWVFDPQADLNISSSDLELVVGCEISDLPRLVGTSTTASAEGTEIVYTYRLIAWGMSPDEGVTNMLGSLKWSGGGVEMSRVVTLTRSE